MKMSHPQHEPVNFGVRRPARIRARALDIRAGKFAQDLNALTRTLVDTELLTRLAQNLTDPARLAPHLDTMGRLANDAVRLVRQVRESCLLCQSGKNPARNDRSRSIPVSPWRAATFKVTVRRLKSPPCSRSAPQVSMVQTNPRATFFSRC